MHGMVKIDWSCSFEQVRNELRVDNLQGQRWEKHKKMMKIVKDIEGLVLMNVSGISLNEYVNNLSFLDILEIDGDFILLISKVDK